MFEERNIDWEVMYNEYRPRVHAHTSDHELFIILSEMIDPIEDGHIAIASPKYGIFDSNRYFQERIDDELFDLEMIKDRYLVNGFKTDGMHYVYGNVLGTNITYIHFDQFRSTSVRLNDMLKDYPHSEGYIIDLRHNNGGDVSFSFAFLGRFTNQDHMFLRSKTKNGKRYNDYTPWFEWYLRKSGTFIDKPLVILTDRYTVSAAERMVMAAKTLPNATIIGDFTNGTFGTKISRQLANGWYISYSIQKVEMFDGKSYEGVGLGPDIWIKNDIHNMRANIDETLQAGIEHIRHHTNHP